jgi:fimbrial chaperone protein
MRSAIFSIACLLLALPARAEAPATVMPTTVMDVAPTLLRLQPGGAGLFYVSNRGAAPLAVELRPMDWAQRGGLDQLSASSTLFISPPVVTIAPGARQSVRLLAKRAGSYRLLVSELPDPNADPGQVKVMLQFSVPVFVGVAGAPSLSWGARQDGGALHLSVANTGPVPVKLAAPMLGGVKLGDGPLYVLAGARRDFTLARAAAPGGALRLTARDMLSGRVLDTDVVP